MSHIGTNDINNHTSDKVNAEKLREDIINIYKCFISFWMKEVIMSLVVPEWDIDLTHLIRTANDSLSD